MLSLSAIHVHRLHQIATAQKPVSEYQSLKRYRDSASSQRPYKLSINMVVDWIRKRILCLQSGSCLSTPPRTEVVQRTSRSQAGTLRLDLPLLFTGKTPQRNVSSKLYEFESKLASGKLDNKCRLVLDRSKQCTGFSLFRIGDDGTLNGPTSRGVCAFCLSQTHTYCLQCKRWLCDRLSDNASKQDGFKDNIVINGSGDKPIFVQNNCHLHTHRSAKERVLKEYTMSSMKQM